MTTSRLFLLLLCSFFSFSVSAQLDFKLQLMPNGTRWGVYAVPDSTISPSTNTITGSGQVTIVAPLGFEIEGFENGSGLWTNNAVINAPTENPSRSYISFGLVSDMPGIDYSATQPTLLFTFKKTGDCPDSLHLIENGVDPFDQLPNSANSNPGNEITVIDFGVFPIGQYTYHNNIALFAWDCHDCDGDGIPNAHEDTNGDGEWTPGVDVSDLCDGGGGGGCEAITAAQLRCASGGTGCGDNPSDPVSLAIDITGGTPPFTVKYSNGSTIFTLQNYQSGTSFDVPASNGAVYSLLEITESEGCAGNPDDFTGEVEILVPGAAQFTTQPANVTVCADESASFVACASATNGSFDIRWEFSVNNGATWQPLNMTGVFSQSDLGNGCKTLFVDNVNGLHGYRFRAVAEGTNVATATSQAATLTVQGPVQVGSQPVNVKVCGGGTAVFMANFTNSGGGDIEYTWQLSHNNGASWWDAMPGPDLTGINSTELTLENVPGNFNGDIYRLRARLGDCGFVYTQTALLTVEGPLEVTAHPVNVKVCAGESAVFTAEMGNFGTGNIEYLWQLSHNNGASWWDVTPSANITGVNSPTLTIQSVPGNFNGDIFRLRGRVGGCNAVFTLSALLTVEGPIEISALVQPVTVCRGTEACFEVVANVLNAGQLHYQWQVKIPGGADWTDIAGANAAVYCAANTDGLNGVCYRALVRTDACAAVVTADACLTVAGYAEFVSQPQDAVVCGGESMTFTSAAVVEAGYAGDVTYRWQASPNGGLTWQNLGNGANISGAFSNELTIENVSSLNGWQFRLQASTGICEARNSEAASLTVEGPVEFSQQPQVVTVCADDEAEFTVSAENLGAGSLQLQWQVSQDGGTTWTDIAEGGNYTGTQTQTLHVGQAAGLDGFQYRLVARTALCEAASQPAVLTLEDELTCNPPAGDEDCVMLAVKKLDNNIGWSVWVKADSSFTETPYQLPTGGKVTLVVPIGFAFQGLTSHGGGKWNPGKVFFNPPQDPGKIYVEFNLTPNQNTLELAPGAERLLFTFSVVNGCPTSLSLMDSIVPPGFFRNEFTGFGAGDGPNVPFHFCGTYAQDEWECPPTWNAVGIESDFDFAEEMENEQGLNGGYSVENEQVAPHFGVYPNPVRDELTVVLNEALAEKSASLRLWNLQGQLLLHENIDGETTRRLDLGHLTAGVYFLTLEVDGRVVKREKVVVQ